MRVVVSVAMFFFLVGTIKAQNEKKTTVKYDTRTDAQKKADAEILATGGAIAGGSLFVCFGVIILVFVFSLLPGLIAALRGHHNTAAIFATAILLGWTGIGWVVALIWSFTSPEPPKRRYGTD